MIDLPMASVPSDKIAALKEIAEKPHNFYTGFIRQFLTSEGEIYCIDTRYDGDLIRAGLLEADADTNHSPKED